MTVSRFISKGYVTPNRRKALGVLWASMIALLLVCLPVFPQGSQGMIRGTVADQSGGVVVGAMVTVTDTARGITKNLVTDSAGEYVANNLIPGTYTIRAEAKGFRAVEHSNVPIEVGQTIRMDMDLQPGEQT